MYSVSSYSNEASIQKHFDILQCYITFPNFQMMFMWFNSNTTGATSGTGTTDPSGAPEFTPVFS